MGVFLAEQWVTEGGAVQLGWPRCGRAAGWPEALGGGGQEGCSSLRSRPSSSGVGERGAAWRGWGAAQALPEAGKQAQLPSRTNTATLRIAGEKVKAFPC